jgi:DinB superfamily
MRETPEQYTKRMLALVGTNDPWTVLASTPSLLHTLVADRPRAQLERKPDPGRWSVIEILAHLADAEIVGAWRIRAILASDGTPLQPYDQDRWAATFRYGDSDPFESLELFGTVRTGTLSLLRRVDRSLHDNYGMHGERGRETVTHIVRMYAGHDLNHFQQIERLLATESAARGTVVS